MAFYADLFSRSDRQSDGPPELETPEQERLFDTLPAEVADHAADRATTPADRREADQARRLLDADLPDRQGLGALTRPLPAGGRGPASRVTPVDQPAFFHGHRVPA
ncbi:hypothetical protein ACQPZF_15620 [Actinosynnema sp. CS-041913]|uniref:hypothetical protein n=1 Tax=Actinosynnema sp. CS-041913 TaxID=3239917 RepID=UPI003D93A4E7